MIASDEVGFGAWAGPLVICAVSAPIGWEDSRVKDSKELHERERERLYEEFFSDPKFLSSVVCLDSGLIDRRGVYEALNYGHEKALKEVAAKLSSPALGVVDGTLPVYKFEVDFPLVALPKADQLVPECALASIFAKVTRDRRMKELDQKYPDYGFAQHKGYGGNAVHEEALRRLGPCPEHRTSYRPIAQLLIDREDGTDPKRAWELLDDDDD